MYIKRKEQSGPHYMKNSLWREQWQDLYKYCRDNQREGADPVTVAVVMWDGSMVPGHVVSIWVDRNQYFVQVELNGAPFVIHPMWVYVDWGGVDGRGYHESEIRDLKSLEMC